MIPDRPENSFAQPEIKRAGEPDPAASDPVFSFKSSWRREIQLGTHLFKNLPIRIVGTHPVTS